MRLVWEFEPGFWLNKPSEVNRVVDAVDHPHFKLLFDTSHAYMGAVVGARQTGEKETLAGGVVDYARLLAPHIGHFHVIDSNGSLHHGETSTHTPFGAGAYRFQRRADRDETDPRAAGLVVRRLLLLPDYRSRCPQGESLFAVIDCDLG